MKKLFTAALVAVTLGVIIAQFRCNICNGTGWRQGFKCWACNGTGRK